MTIRWRFCKEAEREHERSQRQYAHTFHHGDIICLCHAFWDLPPAYRDGILLHEAGHLLVGPGGSEQEATQAAEEWFDVPIRYVDSPYGKSLERTMARRRRR